MTDQQDAKVIEFAKKYAGQEVYLLKRDKTKDVMARVIGWYHDPTSATMLLIDFPNNSLRLKDCWELSQYPSYIHLTISEDVKVGNVVELKNIKPIQKINPYPHACGSCGAPAKINGTMNMCSNTSCKTRKQYIKSLPRIVVAKKAQETKFVICPNCGIRTIKEIGGNVGEPNKFRLRCMNRHGFDVYIANNTHIIVGSGERTTEYNFMDGRFIKLEERV